MPKVVSCTGNVHSQLELLTPRLIQKSHHEHTGSGIIDDTKDTVSSSGSEIDSDGLSGKSSDMGGRLED